MKLYEKNWSKLWIARFDGNDHEDVICETLEDALDEARDMTRNYDSTAYVGDFTPEDVIYYEDPADPDSWVEEDGPECGVDGFGHDCYIAVYGGKTWNQWLASFKFDCWRNFGHEIKADGHEYQLTIDPEKDNFMGEAVYVASAIRDDSKANDEDGTVELFDLYWDILPDWDGEDEALACDWENPTVRESSRFLRLADECRV